MKKITVTISNGGQVEVDVNGVKGPSCQKYTDAIVKAISGEVIKDEKKPEFYEKAANSVKTSS